MTTRAWYQFRRSTLFAVLLAAAILLSLNLRVADRSGPGVHERVRGWPLVWKTESVPSDLLPGAIVKRTKTKDYAALATDVATSLGILLAVGFAMEWGARRRESNS